MERKINTLLFVVVAGFTFLLLSFYSKKNKLNFNAPYFVMVEDYEPQRGKIFYLYDINHPAMVKKDGSIKSRSEFTNEVIRHNAKECNFIQADLLELVTPNELFHSKEFDKIFRNEDGSFLPRNAIIKNFESVLVSNGKLNAADTLVINKDSIYYRNLRSLYFEKPSSADHSLEWGTLENEGTIPLDVLKSNAIMPLKVMDAAGNEVQVHQAKIGFYTWKQVCGKMGFEKSYAPLMKNGILSKNAVRKIQSLNQSGECVLISNIIIFKDGKFVELNERFKFVVKNSVISV